MRKLNNKFDLILPDSDIHLNLLHYFHNDVFLVDKSYQVDGVDYHFYLKYDLTYPYQFVIECYKLDNDSNHLSVSFDMFDFNSVYESYLRFKDFITFSINDSLDDLDSNVDDVYGLVDDLKTNVDDVSNDIKGISTHMNDYYNTLLSHIGVVESKFDDINCDVDLTTVTEKLNSIDSKIDVLKVMDISNMIDEKLSQLFSMKSLNGSNGSKFKDGVSVTVKGYDGNWVVEGSYPMLNADNVTIIVYKLKQNDMVLLAPAPFVEKV